MFPLSYRNNLHLILYLLNSFTTYEEFSKYALHIPIEYKQEIKANSETLQSLPKPNK